MPAARKAKPADSSVEGKLDEGHYEQLLAAFRQEIAVARAILKEYQATMQADRRGGERRPRLTPRPRHAPRD